MLWQEIDMSDEAAGSHEVRWARVGQEDEERWGTHAMMLVG